jgi:hypothetical protein
MGDTINVGAEDAVGEQVSRSPTLTASDRLAPPPTLIEVCVLLRRSFFYAYTNSSLLL